MPTETQTMSLVQFVSWQRQDPRRNPLIEMTNCMAIITGSKCRADNKSVELTMVLAPKPKRSGQTPKFDLEDEFNLILPATFQITF